LKGAAGTAAGRGRWGCGRPRPNGRRAEPASSASPLLPWPRRKAGSRRRPGSRRSGPGPHPPTGRRPPLPPPAPSPSCSGPAKARFPAGGPGLATHAGNCSQRRSNRTRRIGSNGRRRAKPAGQRVRGLRACQGLRAAFSGPRPLSCGEGGGSPGAPPIFVVRPPADVNLRPPPDATPPPPGHKGC
jgi:hypothetical protein